MPFSGGYGLDNAKDNQAKPEIYGQSYIVLERGMLDGRREVRDEQRVNRIPRQHGNQGMNEVTHCRFRHRTYLPRAVESSCQPACC